MQQNKRRAAIVALVVAATVGWFGAGVAAAEQSWGSTAPAVSVR